jgi:uncharacterized protein YgbK (DUF1537 family)
VVVGSHVPLADAQLAALLQEPGCVGVEVQVDKVLRVLEGPLPDRMLPSLEMAWGGQLEQALASGRTPVLFTSRGEAPCAGARQRRRLGTALAGITARLAAARAPRLGYLISKGGITSHTLLAEGLAAGRVQLQGQLLPGLSLVLAGVDGDAPASLPVLTLPGNLGAAETLRRAWRRMENPDAA